MKKLVLASSNQGKIAEIRHLLDGLPVEIVSQKDLGLSSVEETGRTFAENALLKAHWVVEKTGLPAVADDSGLEVAALWGQPGVHSARYAGEQADDLANRKKLLHEMKNVPWDERKARFVCVVALSMPGGDDWTAEGYCSGTILLEERGDHGFGYDSIFYYPPLQKTFAEMTEAEKNQVSHRGQAMRRLGNHLQKLFWNI